MKKKITFADWTEIGKYNYGAKWLRPLCAYSLQLEEDGRFKREQRIPLWYYILIFIPVHLAQAFYCMWDGGLVEFEFYERYLGGDWIAEGSPSYEKAKKIWERG